MPRVFISYVRENSELVKRLSNTLKVYGIDVWLDRDQIKPGERWADVIRQGIKQGDFFIACFSSEYNERIKTYMNEELTVAIEELRQRPTDRTWFIPVLLSQGIIPNRSIGAGETLHVFQWVALYEDWDNGLKRILSVVKPNSAKIYELIHDLSNPSARVRIRAADDLGKIGKSAQEAIPALTKALEDPNETVRAIAADALGAIGISTKEVVFKLLATIWGEGYYDVIHADAAIVKLGEAAIPALVEALGSDDRRVRKGAIESLGKIGRSSVPALLEILRRKHGERDDEPSYIAAIETLGIIGESAKDAVPALIEAMEDKSDNVRVAAMDALGGIGKEANAATPLLIQKMNYYWKEKESDLHADIAAAAAAYALGRIGDPSAIQPLITALSYENYLCVNAAYALAEIGEPTEIIVPALIAVLSDEKKSWVPRSSAAAALGKIGKRAAPAVPILLKILQSRSTEDESDRLRAAAASGLGDIGEAARTAIPVLIQALNHADEYVCRCAAEALGKMADSAKVAIPALMGALNHPSEYVLVAAAEALNALGEPPITAIPRLIMTLDAENGSLRTAAAIQLGKMGGAARTATPKLQDLLGDKHPDVRAAVAEALSKISLQDDSTTSTRPSLISPVSPVQEVFFDAPVSPIPLASSTALSETPPLLPCGHELRSPSARFCSVCGAPVPS